MVNQSRIIYCNVWCNKPTIRRTYDIYRCTDLPLNCFCAISGHIGVVVGRKEQESSASFVACRITGKKAAVFINDRASVIMSECEVWSDVLGVGILQARARLLNCRVIAKLPLSYDVKPELVGCTLTDTAIAGKET